MLLDSQELTSVEVNSKYEDFSCNKIILKMLFAKRRPFCLCLNVLILHADRQQCHGPLLADIYCPLLHKHNIDIHNESMGKSTETGKLLETIKQSMFSTVH